MTRPPSSATGNGGGRACRRTTRRGRAGRTGGIGIHDRIRRTGGNFRLNLARKYTIFLDERRENTQTKQGLFSKFFQWEDSSWQNTLGWTKTPASPAEPAARRRRTFTTMTTKD